MSETCSKRSRTKRTRASNTQSSNHYSETGPEKGRGMSKASRELIGVMYDIAAECQPITVRGIGYKLFAVGFIESMDRSPMQRVYRLVKEAREQEIIPWEWIVDGTRELERPATWDGPEEFVFVNGNSYRRNPATTGSCFGGQREGNGARSTCPCTRSLLC